jgi:hypothetical protein
VRDLDRFPDGITREFGESARGRKGKDQARNPNSQTHSLSSLPAVGFATKFRIDPA